MNQYQLKAFVNKLKSKKAMVTIEIYDYSSDEKKSTSTTYNIDPTFEQMKDLHAEYSEANPDACVNICHSNGSFILGMREREKRDEKLLEIDLIDWAEYTKRNYPELLN